MVLKPNMSEKDANHYMMAGLAAMALGLIYFVLKPHGAIIGAIGAIAFGMGWHRRSPFNRWR